MPDQKEPPLQRSEHPARDRSQRRLAGFLGLLAPIGMVLAGCANPARVPDAGETATLNVASYNIKHGLGMDGVIDLERTARVLESLDAEVIALQEVDDRARRSDGVDQAAWLGERLGMTHRFGAFMPFQGGRYGLALLTSLPITDHATWRLSDGNEPRVALAVTLEARDGRAVTVIVVHFDWVDDDAFRFTQAEETIARLGTVETPWIVIGDFNDVPGSRTMNAFAECGSLLDKEPGNAATFPSEDPRIDIDHVVTGPARSWPAGVISVIDERIASDHRPLRVGLLPPPER